MNNGLRIAAFAAALAATFGIAYGVGRGIDPLVAPEEHPAVGTHRLLPGLRLGGEVRTADLAVRSAPLGESTGGRGAEAGEGRVR
ncbi:hypothetical protein [Streptomyces sp. NPDC052042]|uniref:hypothetical protein n=1 Tax=Streptomyces sp. NPDC052042 TaxID=3365683 RepID=UPI0037CD9F17